MLLVDDQQPEPLEAHVTLKQPVRADDDVDRTPLHPFERARLSFLVDETRKHLDRDRKVLEPFREHVEVLLRQHGGRR